MTTVDLKMEASITATITLTEGQLRALDALAGYGDDAFLKAFNVKLGSHYIKPFERDLRDLFSAVRRDVPRSLREIEEIRKAFGLPSSTCKMSKKLEKP